VLDVHQQVLVYCYVVLVYCYVVLVYFYVVLVYCYVVLSVFSKCVQFYKTGNFIESK